MPAGNLCSMFLFFSLLFIIEINGSINNPFRAGISENCIKVKINFNFLFSHFFVVAQNWNGNEFKRINSILKIFSEKKIFFLFYDFSTGTRSNLNHLNLNYLKFPVKFISTSLLLGSDVTAIHYLRFANNISDTAMYSSN